MYLNHIISQTYIYTFPIHPLSSKIEVNMNLIGPGDVLFIQPLRLLLNNLLAFYVLFSLNLSNSILSSSTAHLLYLVVFYGLVLLYIVQCTVMVQRLVQMSHNQGTLIQIPLKQFLLKNKGGKVWLWKQENDWKLLLHNVASHTVNVT